MSSSTFILIREIKPNRYSVSLKSFDIQAGYDRKYFDDLKEAIRYANKLIDNEIVEYGIVINLLDNPDKNG